MYLLDDLNNNLSTFKLLKKDQYYKGSSFWDRQTFDKIGIWDIKTGNTQEKDTSHKTSETKLNCCEQQCRTMLEEAFWEATLQFLPPFHTTKKLLQQHQRKETKKEVTNFTPRVNSWARKYLEHNINNLLGQRRCFLWHLSEDKEWRSSNPRGTCWGQSAARDGDSLLWPPYRRQTGSFKPTAVTAPSSHWKPYSLSECDAAERML